ncbi:MAG TPA: response regulator [Mobilitalea sp.]|nr:response regulator [Mobilitalea sp.]
MLKVIIADDEPVIINGLKMLLEWEKLGCEIVGEACDGSEALKLLEDEKPNIAIFDICMPGLTGIELIKRINHNNWKVKVIFISGYQDFFYAKEAISQGAVEYLLKPVKKDILEQAVKKAQMLIWEQDPIQVLKEPKNEIQEIFGLINENDEYAEQELYDRFTRLGLDYSGKLAVGVCFAISNQDKKALQKKMYEKYELLRFSVFNKIQDYFMNKKNGFVVKRDDDSCNLIVLVPKRGRKELLQQEIDSVIDLIHQDYRIELFVAIGEYVDSMKAMKLAYKTARFAFELRFFDNKRIISYDEINKDYEKSFEDYQSICDKIAGDIITGSNELEWDLRSCLDIIENLHYGNRYAVINRCLSFAVNMYRILEGYHLVNSDMLDKQDEFMSKLRNMDTFQELRQEFMLYYKALIDQIYHNNKDKIEVAKIKNYIQQNYAGNLTLEHMAKLVYMNSYYFSSFFKKETGENFKEYLTNIRMKEAIRLIMSTDMKTYEIAEMVGYNNVRQFTSKFVELFKVSPSDYKKQLEK